MNEESILQKISQKYFQGIADEISNTKNISSVFPNMTDVGDSRENIFLKFLKLHLLPRCSVARGGFIFDLKGNTSKQIDIIVANDFALKFSYFEQYSDNSKNIQAIEGCLAAISIKSTLNKTELEETLNNLASIPPMPADIVDSINPQLCDRDTYLGFPRKIVFAFSGQSVKTTLKQINKFYSSNEIHDSQKADLIVVNNSFCIQRVYKGGGQIRNGDIIPEGTFHPMFSKENRKKFGALPLLWTLMKIQETGLFTPHVLFNYQKYFDSIDFH